jgi:hypothetical protein
MEGVESTVAPIQRRYPRLGSAFQTKVPGLSEAPYQPSRRSPVLLSSEFPDVAMEDTQRNDMEVEGESYFPRLYCRKVTWKALGMVHAPAMVVAYEWPS